MSEVLPETIAANVRKTSRVLGIGQGELFALAAELPALLYLSPESIRAKLKALGESLGLDRAAVCAMARERPTVLSYALPTLLGRVAAFQDMLGGNRMAARVLKRSPYLLTMAPETVRTKLDAIPAALGVEKGAFMVAWVNQPTLLNLKPETIRANVAESARALGITPAEFMAVALRMPTLLYRSPADMRRKGRLLRALFRACGEERPFPEALEAAPAALTYRAERILARVLIARGGLRKQKAGALVVMPNRRADAILIEAIRAALPPRAAKACLARWREKGVLGLEAA